MQLIDTKEIIIILLLVRALKNHHLLQAAKKVLLKSHQVVLHQAVLHQVRNPVLPHLQILLITVEIRKLLPHEIDNEEVSESQAV